MQKKMINKIIFPLVVATLFSSCALSPGMFMSSSNNWDGENTVFVKSLNRTIIIEQITKKIQSKKNLDSYKIGNGDQLFVTIWGLPDIFPVNGVANSELNTRRVDSNGNIYFPYIGLVSAKGRTQDELREDLTIELSKMFKNIQLDIAITGFNSQKVYLLGEVTTPKLIKLTDIPLSLANAIGESKGLNTNTSEGEDVFVIRQIPTMDPQIYRVNLSSPSGFFSAGNFYLTDNDIVYVNAKGTTRWNRVISQFFPFSTFLNSVDNLVDD
jgi:polysaccharide export outer membrane protein|tara:strand:- start:387 stop:1193 length:807 start_codon:yes stop_codon:yes gene_type:complete